MKAVASGLFAVALIAGVAGCAPPPAPPPPPAPVVAPMPPPPPMAMPAPPPPPRVVKRCGKGRHWVRAHRAASGKWVRGHCVRNR